MKNRHFYEYILYILMLPSCRAQINSTSMLESVRVEEGQDWMPQTFHQNIFAAPGKEKTGSILGQHRSITESINVALNKKATQSSTFCSCQSKNKNCCFDASRAVDGSTDGYDKSTVTRTIKPEASEPSSSWWRVELGSSFSIEEIRVYSRMDKNWPKTLSGFVANIYHQDSVVWTYAHPSATPGDVTSIPVSPHVLGDTVEITLPSKSLKSISLAEVEVYSHVLTNTNKISCLEDSAGKFFHSLNDDGTPRYRTCAWLAQRKENNINQICQSTESHGGKKPARKVCKNTCNTCSSKVSTNPPKEEDTTDMPTTSPTASPTASPMSEPSSSPTTCFESSSASFFIRFKNDDTSQPVYRTCKWLRKQKKKSACFMKESFNGMNLAREVCMDTCGSCDHMNPSQAPSPVPTLDASNSPSSIASLEPSEAPSSEHSSYPSMSPTTCFENRKAEFFLQMSKSIGYDEPQPTYKSCGWLQRQKPQFAAKVCARKKKFNSFGPASEVCMNTCGTCGNMNPSQAPSPSPTASPMSEPSSSPTTCFESASTSFFIRFNDDDTSQPVYRTCKWLRQQKKKSACFMKESFNGMNLAREVCMDTCGSCDHMNPSQAPSPVPTLDASNSPSSVASLESSEAPSSEHSSYPSMSPTTCFEDRKDKFIFELKSNGLNTESQLTYKSCGWLQRRKPQFAAKVCARKKKFNGNNKGNARDVCMNTCGTCNERPNPPSKKPFLIKSIFNEFTSMFNRGADWCLQASTLGQNAMLNVRMCSSDLEAKQKWFLDGDGQFRLVSYPDKCIVWEGKIMMLAMCEDGDSGTKHPLVYNEEDKSISIVKTGPTLQQERSDTNYLVGFDPYRLFSRLSLYKEADHNPSLHTWVLEYDQ